MATCKFNENRGRWVIRFYDQSGKQGWETMPKGATAREAKRRVREIEELTEKKVFKRPTQIPVFQDVAKQWLDVRAANIRHTTLDQYRGHIDNHLNPFFENIKTNEISLELVERFITQCANQGMSANTMRKVLTTLGSIMSYAAHPKRCYASYNPVRYAENRPKLVKKEADMATPDEVLAIIDLMENPRDRLIVRTMAICGLRAGETLGLRWTDIQWEDTQIFVRQTYNHGRFYDPKSEKSKRKIDVPQRLLDELKKWKELGSETEGLIFSNRKGGPIDETNWLRQVWHPAREQAKVRHLTPKSMRHLNGSFLLDQGEDVGYVQDHLGHSSIDMTMNVYRHKMKKCNRGAAEKLGAAFYKDPIQTCAKYVQ